MFDPNRICWNCKHYAPFDRSQYIDGECHLSPPIWDGAQTVFQWLPDARENYCGHWERNNVDYGTQSLAARTFAVDANGEFDITKVRPGRTIKQQKKRGE